MPTSGRNYPNSPFDKSDKTGFQTDIPDSKPDSIDPEPVTSDFENGAAKSSARPFESLESARARFDDARARIITLAARERRGIGMLSEKKLHAVIKHYIDPDGDHHEIPVGRFVADIFYDGRITEIQTAHMDAMRAKLAFFLTQYEVRVVYPIPAQKWVLWVDPQTGETVSRRRSPLRGSFYHAFRELYRIRPFLTHPNLSFELLLIDMDEYRLLDGWSHDKKRGSHRYERVPLGLRDRMLLTCREDYRQFVPEGLSEPFTSADFAKAAGFPKKKTSTVLLLLTELGVLERVGKKGNAYLYRKIDAKGSSPDF